MKKWITLLISMALVFGCLSALAEAGREAPADKDVIETDVIKGYTTSFRKYDAKFYDAPSLRPGTLEKLTYTTSVYGKEIENWVNVYLPYGYDPNGTERYNILYFYHGTNETQDSFIGDERAKNCMDNMIEAGLTEPFIMVFPTYYYDYENRACDLELFQEEMRNDIMPAVESTYRTYAQTADDEGFAVSRTHRAICGYSQGCRMCWYSFLHLMDRAYWFLPFSNQVGVNMLIRSMEEHPEYRNQFFVYAGCGGKRDGLAEQTVSLINSLIAGSDAFSFGTDLETNTVYLSVSKDLHQTLTSRYYLYNAFVDGLFQ